jgi:hypothetical protein
MAKSALRRDGEVEGRFLITSRIAADAVDQTRWRILVNGLRSNALLLAAATWA